MTAKKPSIVIAAMMAVSALSMAVSLEDEIVRNIHWIPSRVGMADAAAKRLLSLIPKGGTLGFITDSDDADVIAGRLYSTTYSLVPVAIDSTPNRSLVVGDFRRESSVSAALRRYHLRVVADAGDGFLLLAAQ